MRNPLSVAATSPFGSAVKIKDYLITVIAVGMSIYHLLIAYNGGYEPLYQRTLTYIFGLSLIFLVYPVNRPLPQRLVIDGILFALAVISVGYPVLFTDYFLDRLAYVDPLMPIDLILGVIVILLTLEAARRTINNALPLISLFFLAYTYWGQYFPWEFRHKGASFEHIIDHQYMTYDGLWTTPINVFSVYIFLFILFGTFLERMGAADFYVRLSIALTGRRRGGPAKAAIFASAMTGSITGSANANVATTGSFTIPMMIKAKFRPEFSAGVETAASTGGQIMPPIMGASAFLIVEFTGISYWEIVKVSILPAVLYFFSVYAIVHLEARKSGLTGMSKDEVPDVMPILREGWYYLLPPIIIMGFLMQGKSVPYSGLIGIASIVILAGLRGLFTYFGNARLQGFSAKSFFYLIRAGFDNIVKALEQGACKSLPICAAVGAVGLVMGALFQTGLGLKFASLVTSLAQGSLFLGIVLVGIASFVLGMGLPTSAAYIVLSIMAVPALLDLGQSVQLSLLAAHLIVFWFSLDSCFTPPVCVPAYTAAGIAGANPSKAAWAAFRTAKGMYIIPLLFAYSSILTISDPLMLGITFLAALAGFLCTASLIVGHMYVDLNWTDRAVLAIAAICLFWPMQFLHLAGIGLLIWVFISQQKKFEQQKSVDASVSA